MLAYSQCSVSNLAVWGEESLAQVTRTNTNDPAVELALLVLSTQTTTIADENLSDKCSQTRPCF